MIRARPPEAGVAILGYGAIADLHATAMRMAGATLLQVAGPKPDEVRAFAARHGFRHAAISPEAAIDADGVDLVVIASPSQVHAAQARRALEAGRHVLVEIPLALALADGEELATLAAQKGLLLGVCHTLRFWEPFLYAQAAIDAAGTTPSQVVARWLQRRHENVGWTGRARSWTDDLLWHHGGHVIDLSLAFLRSPVVRVGAAVGGRLEGSGSPMDYAIALQTAAGGIASIALSYNAVVGAAGYTVIVDDETYEIEGARLRSSRGVLWDGDERATEARAVAGQDAAFVAAVRGGPSFAAEARLILPTLRVQDAVARAT